jgi:hypothetical protein
MCQKKSKSSSTGVRGLYYRHSSVSNGYISAEIMIQKQVILKCFNLSKYHDDYYEALAAAKAWHDAQ